MTVKALKSFTYQNNILSMYAGEVADIDSTIAADLIAEGYVEEYSGGEPTGTISISENGTYNVAPYASAEVSVSGGGGSSDFSTAEVTVTSYIAMVDNDSVQLVTGLGGTKMIASNPFTSGSRSVTFVLYKGKQEFEITSDELPTVNVTGDIQYDDGLVTITGQGTITIS